MRKRDEWLIVLGVVGLVLWLSTRKVSAMTLTGRSQSFFAFAKAISIAEGYGVPGAIPTVRNNPGDLMLSAGTITTFATPNAGWEALYHQLDVMKTDSAFYSPSMTLAQVARVWTATEQSAWLANVIAAMRQQGFDVDENTLLGDVL